MCVLFFQLGPLRGGDLFQAKGHHYSAFELLGGDGALVVMTIDYPHGEYRPGDQLWLRQLDPADAARAVNRDVLVPRKNGRFAFGRLIDRQGKLVGLLPPGHGEKQQVVENPAWIGVAEMLVRRL